MKKIGKFVSYTDQVYREIKDAVISLDIRPGDLLQERSIAEKLGVSRTPVREALKKLEFEGWVETIPWKGVVVKEIERQDIFEVFQCRYANEGFVGELVAPLITDDHMTDLKEYQKRMTSLAEQDRQQFINEDRDFHMYLAQLTGNSRLIQFLDHLSDQMLRFGIRAVSEDSRMKETLKEHQAIIDAFDTGSKEKARKALEFHIQNSQEILLAMIDEEEAN